MAKKILLRFNISMLTVTDNTRRPSFHGLTSKLAKNMHPVGDIIELYEKEKARTNGIVGTIPPEWVARIPYRKRREAVKSILNAFSLAAKDPQLSSDGNLKQIFLPVVQALKKYRVIKSADDFNAKYLGSGAYGEVYKVSVNGQNYAMKSFYSFWEQNSKNVDGNFVEQAAALFINKHYPNKNWSKFYFGDLGAKTMFSKFSSYENLYRGKQANVEESGLVLNADHFADYNVKGKRCVDFGHLEFFEQALNKTHRYVCKTAMRSQASVLKLLEQTLSWKSSGMADDRIQGCILALRYLDTPLKNRILPRILPVINEKNALVLSKSITFIPKARRESVFERLIALGNDEVHVNLAKNIVLLQKPEVSFALLSSMQNRDVDRQLAKYLYVLATKERVKYFEHFLSLDDNGLNKILAGSLSSLPKNVQSVYLLKLLEKPEMFNSVLQNSTGLSHRAFDVFNEWITQKGIF